MSAIVLVAALREKLRAKAVTYAQLAAGIGVSESTVKRMLNAPADMTLGRLEDITRFLGITFADLIQPPATEDELHAMTVEQEEVLARSPHLLNVFYAATTDLTIGQMATYSREGRAQVSGALTRLEAAGLVTTTLGGRVKPNVSTSAGWSGKGPLHAEHFPRMRREFLGSTLS